MLLEGQEVLMAQDSLPVLRAQDMEKKERLAFVFVLGACCSWFAMTPTTRFLPLPRDNCFNLNCVLLFKHLLHLLNLPLLITVQIRGSCSFLSLLALVSLYGCESHSAHCRGAALVAFSCSNGASKRGLRGEPEDDSDRAKCSHPFAGTGLNYC